MHRASGSWPRGARPLTRGCWDGAVSMCQGPAEGGTGRRGRACPMGPGTDIPRGPLTQCLSGGWRERLKTLFPFVSDAPAYTVPLGSAGEPVGREEVFCMLHTCNICAYNLARHRANVLEATTWKRHIATGPGRDAEVKDLNLLSSQQAALCRDGIASCGDTPAWGGLWSGGTQSGWSGGSGLSEQPPWASQVSWLNTT